MKNMKFIYRLAFAAMLGGSVMTTACDGILDVEPRQSIDADGALSSPEAVNAALNSVYARLRSIGNYGRNLMAVSDALADVGVTTGNSGRLIQENNNQPNNHFNNEGNVFWQNSYYAINEANLILDGIAQGVEGASATQIAAWEGEAKFLRALYYFDLVKSYSYIPTAIYTAGLTDEGGIPMPLEGSITSDIGMNRSSPRATIDEVYSQIYNDLNDAIASLGNGPVQYASRGAAQGLLSRVALYRGDWELAANQATEALGSSAGNVLSGQAYVDGWRAESHPEAMFEVRYAIPGESNGVNLSLSSSYTTLLNLDASKNSQGGWGDFVPNQRVRDFFGLAPLHLGGDESDNNNWDVTRNNDVRAFLYTTGSNIRGAGRQIECIKFISKTGFAYADNVPVIRKSEMHLNRAEANFHLGNTAEALDELNAFKGLRGLEPVQLTGEAILDEILIERFKEFAFEGHRFYDLKRYSQAIDKTSYLGANALVPFDDFRILPPFPQREVDINTNLNQNRGY
ncbi:RagB/SusD family nutrient uptake outer membrane protein [Litoribacter ruber]|uniref:RagB/SusD family nutrient uptake outer membrane protein n=1 Tax=Litoribacter ruber TaxID=702568 RepID=UPI001BDA10D5|nr:RagB/SusD family nutrient uptake outer membrane protein [Litoribacter ruber]MBT0811976.1 RagB/SusD family nutrient uptake outer membrane protein [Litoribacter ruber]